MRDGGALRALVVLLKAENFFQLFQVFRYAHLFYIGCGFQGYLGVDQCLYPREKPLHLRFGEQAAHLRFCQLVHDRGYPAEQADLPIVHSLSPLSIRASGREG